MPCENTHPCSCPKTSCVNHGKCCACVARHKHMDKLPFCLFGEEGGEQRLEKFYRELKERFEKE